MTTKYRCLFLLLSTGTLLLGRESPSLSNCDVNQDGTTTVSDVQHIVNEALGSIAAAHDLNGDGGVNVVDVRWVMNAALGSGCAADPSSGLSISAFNPKSGPIGTLVTATGNNFGSAPVVSLPMLGGGAISQPLSNSSATSVSFVIAAGTATGPITVATSAGSIASLASFTVTPSTTFTVTAGPQSASLIAGQSTTYTVSLATANGFTQLATLSVSGLPAGLTAVFNPAQITAGESSTLTIAAPAKQGAGTAPLIVTASTSVEGLLESLSANVTLHVMPVTTSFLARTVVDDGPQTPLANVKVSMLGTDGGGNLTGCTGNAVSDGSGNVTLTGLSSSCIGPQLIGFDGSAVTSPAGQYAGVNLVFTLVSGAVVVSPILVHMPRYDTAGALMVTQNSNVDQTFTLPSIPHLQLTFYAGTTLTMQDGTRPNPFPVVAIEMPIDRLPDVMPLTNTMVTPFIVAFQPTNTTSSQPIAVWFPNLLNTPPGTSLPLMSLDAVRGRMVAYGTGSISNDGTTVTPDIDPSTGYLQHRFGISNFDWVGSVVTFADRALLPPPPGDIADNDPNPTDPSKDPCSPGTNSPVDVASGVEVITETDVSMAGSLSAVPFVRTYRTMTDNPGPFGIGTSHNYGYRLDSANPQSVALVNLVLPDGNQIPFSEQPGGILTNSSSPAYLGVVMTTAPDGTSAVRFKDGSVFRFTPSNRPSEGSVLSAMVDPNGNTTTITGSASDSAAITQITDAAGRSWNFTNDTLNRISSITDVLGRTVTYTYTALNQLATVTDQAGGVTQYAYDTETGFLSQITDPRNVVTIQDLYYSTSYVNTLPGAPASLVGRIRQQVEADGGVWNYSYTSANPLVPGSPVLETDITNPRGFVTKYRFNSEGYLTGVTDAMMQTRSIARQAGTNLVMSVTGPGSCSICGTPSGPNESYTYDGNGNRLTVTDSAGKTTTFTHDPVFNKLLTVTDPTGSAVQLSYTPSGYIKTIADSLGNSSAIAYTATGQPVMTTDPLGKLNTLTYDLTGNVVSMKDEVGSVLQFGYDAVSRLVQTRDALGRNATLTYDAGNRPMISTDANGAIVKYTYNAIGQILTVTDPAGGAMTFTYDGMGRLATRKDPAGAIETYTYDLNSNLAGFTDRRGLSSSFTYDALDRRIGETYADGSTVTRTYDSTGYLVRIADSARGTFTFGYDGNGRVTQTSTPYGTVAYGYDAAGRLISRQVAGDPAVTYGYDSAGRVVSASMTGAAVQVTLDAAGRVVTMTRSNGVNSTVTYDPAGNITGIAHANGGGAGIDSQAYTYDPNGLKTSASSTLTQPLATQAAAATYNSAGRLLQFGVTRYTYDANGNRLTETNPLGTTAYTWGARNELQSISLPGGATVSFGYDFQDQMILRTQTVSGVSVSQRFVLDQISNIVSTNTSLGQHWAILTGLGMDQLFATVGTGGTAFGLVNAQSSIVASTDASGNVSAKVSYDAYGGTASTTSYLVGFTGRIPVTPTLYNYRARYYDPATAAFLSEDPESIFLGDTNRYRYANNDPVDFTDPTGNCPPCLVSLGTGLIGAGTSAAGNAIGQVISNRLAGKPPFKNFSWGQVAIAGGTGFVQGAVAPFLGPHILTAMALGAATNWAQNAINNHANGLPLHCGGLYAALTGALGGRAGGAFKEPERLVKGQLLESAPRHAAWINDRLWKNQWLKSTPSGTGGNVISNISLPDNSNTLPDKKQ